MSIASLAPVLFLLALPAQALAPHEELAQEIYRELVETNTVHPSGDNTAAARAMAKRLLDAGFDAADVQVIEPAPRKGNLVVRLRGTGGRGRSSCSPISTWWRLSGRTGDGSIPSG